VTLPLFVYGSLRDPRVRACVLGERPGLATCPAILCGHERQMVPSFDYPFLVPADVDASVDGELILGLADADYPILDRYEDVDDGLYVRARVTVEMADGPVDAWAYLRGPTAPS
jgi:gamma-glutamylaminecyclotransferase